MATLRVVTFGAVPRSIICNVRVVANSTRRSQYLRWWEVEHDGSARSIPVARHQLHTMIWHTQELLWRCQDPANPHTLADEANWLVQGHVQCVCSRSVRGEVGIVEPRLSRLFGSKGISDLVGLRRARVSMR